MSYTRRLTTSLGPGQACIHSGRDSVTLRPVADARRAEVGVCVTSGTHLESQRHEKKCKTQSLMSFSGQPGDSSIQEVRNQVPPEVLRSSERTDDQSEKRKHGLCAAT